MKEGEHLLLLVVVGAAAFMIGYTVCARKAASQGQGGSSAQGDPSMAWFSNWGGI